MKKKKIDFTTIILIVILIVGLSLLLYPSISDYWNSFHQTRAITSYTTDVSTLDSEEYEAILEKAKAYNQKVLERAGQYVLTDKQKEEYESMLNVSGNGVMGSVEIPQIECRLPIYHGTEESVLQVAIGHLEWSSLPVGGEGSHCIISGHRGLPSARLFTDLDQLAEGDTFVLRVLEEMFTYEVDQILIVEPQDVEALAIEEGKDYCTLITCTPYGVNSHRLLVRGHRVDNASTAYLRVSADARQIDPVIVAPVVAAPMVLLLFIYLLIRYKKK